MCLRELKMIFFFLFTFKESICIGQELFLKKNITTLEDGWILSNTDYKFKPLVDITWRIHINDYSGFAGLSLQITFLEQKGKMTSRQPRIKKRFYSRLITDQSQNLVRK
ncbi:hypothetical protein BD770DRAFT_413618 [Pilaira anomala]|nr:hypothetical protein BD770DRAFT_413618 [Pilaira anomala]